MRKKILKPAAAIVMAVLMGISPAYSSAAGAGTMALPEEIESSENISKGTETPGPQGDSLEETFAGETSAGEMDSEGSSAESSGVPKTTWKQSASPAASPLIVTEVVPASTQKMTYTEVYNNSDAVINLGGYTFYYQYPTGGGKVWNTGDFYLKPGECAVLWQSNNAADNADTFNNYYGTNLVLGKNLYKINYSGIHSTAKRGFAFGRNENSIIAYAECNADGADITDKTKKLAVQYEYAGTGSTSEKREVSAATPGSVEDWQVPDIPVHYENMPEVTLHTVNGPRIIETDAQELTISADLSGNQGYVPAYLCCQQGPQEKKILMTWDESAGKYTASISRNQLWSDEISWKVEAGYGNGSTVSSESQTTAVKYADLTEEEKAPLVVTEVVTPPISAGEFSGNNQFSYVELYNRTDSAINFSYYKLFYEYTGTQTADKTWTVSDPAVMVEPGKALVLWLTNNGNTVEDFNRFYGTDLEENKDIAVINYSGFHESQWRTLKFGRSQDNIFARASFNENNKATMDRSGTQSIQYTYPRTADGQSLIVTTDTKPSPGTVESWQVPGDQSHFMGYPGYPEDDGSSPVLTLHGSCPASIQEGSELFVTFDTSDTLGLIGTKLYYRLDGKGRWEEISTAKNRVPYYYFARIPGDILFGHDSVEFYAEAYNNFRSSRTDIYRVGIDRLNETKGIRLNVSDQQILSGQVTVTANDGAENTETKILLDGEEKDTVRLLENGAFFALTANGRDSYFKNAVTAPYGENSREIIQYIAKWQDLDSKVIHIDNKYFSYNQEKDCYEVTLTLWAGDSGTPFEDIFLPGENHEDYTVTNLRMLLANGREYLPVSIGPDDEATKDKTNLNTELSAVHTIGDSTGMCTRLEVKFEIPGAEVTAVGNTLDTRALEDGLHTITAVSGSKRTEKKVIVDNTAPAIDLGITDGQIVTGTVSINPQVSDLNGIAHLSAVLDGEELEIPYQIPARELQTGEHEISVMAEDGAGNTAISRAIFVTRQTDPSITGAEAAEITEDSARLSVSLGKENSQDTQVSFYKGKNLTLENGGVTVKTGYGDSPLDVKLGSRSLKVTAPDGMLPYQLFTIEAGEVKAEDSVFIKWDGTADYADEDHQLKLYVLNVEKNNWESIGTVDEKGRIETSFAAASHVEEGKAMVLVQCRAQQSAPNAQNNSHNDPVVQKSADAQWDGTGRPENYDFSFAWITDTQYYTESWPEHYVNQNQWIVDHAEDWKIKYVIHTGDIVDEYDMISQWENADKAMKIFDDAGMPYGVLAGNHDVAAGNMLYQNYWNYFGEQRFADSSCYGGSYHNNAGHYDLISQNGQDFLLLYMSWDIYEDEINWMNQVLQQYPDRKAIILLHRYTNVNEKENTYLDYAGKVIQKEVVAKNPNVFAVLNGHYHGSSFETAAFDDDGDGIRERTVYQICTDYQSAFEGGEEYIKFLYFDLKGGKVYMNSYSPLHDDFNYYDTAKYESYEEGNKGKNIDIFELNVDFDLTEKTLDCSGFTAGVRTESLIGSVQAQGQQASVIWEGLEAEREYTWYAVAENTEGGLAVSGMNEFRTAAEESGTETAENSEPESTETESSETKSPESESSESEFAGEQGTITMIPSATDSQGAGVPTGDQTPAAWLIVIVLCSGIAATFLSVGYLKKKTGK